MPTLRLLYLPEILYKRQPAVSACKGNLALKADEVCGAHLRTGSSMTLKCLISLAGQQNTVFLRPIRSSGLIIIRNIKIYVARYIVYSQKSFTMLSNMLWGNTFVTLFCNSNT